MRDASLSAQKFHDFPEERATSRRRAASAPAPAAKKKRSVLARVFGPQRIGVLLLFGIGGLAFVGVPMNALFFQDGKHPAPLFSSHPPAWEKAGDVPTPPARPAQTQTARAEPDSANVETARPKNPAKTDTSALKAEIAKAEPAAAKAEKKRDAITQLLGGAEAAAREAGPDKNVLYAQRALQKLGYVVRPDGVFGGGTRQAIEKFERDNGLPAKGELTPKIARLLAQRASLPRQ